MTEIATDNTPQPRPPRHSPIIDLPLREGEVVVNNLTGRIDTMRYNAIPGVVYTNPEVAGVGETEETAKAKGIAYKVAKLPMTFAGRFVA